jgi:hypothetical protein
MERDRQVEADVEQEEDADRVAAEVEEEQAE